MTHSYPFSSTQARTLKDLQEKVDFFKWGEDAESIQDRLDKLKKPIIEIGGPTETGFYFLDGLALPAKPIITNISSNPSPYSPKADQLAKMVTEQVDGTNLPKADRSIGVILMAAMSLSSDWWVELNEEAKEKAEPLFKEEFLKARLESGQVAAGILGLSEVKYAQKIRIYLEIYRVLCDGGLLFSDGSIEEVVILKNIGFELVALLQINEEWDVSYEFVLAKRL